MTFWSKYDKHSKHQPNKKTTKKTGNMITALLSYIIGSYYFWVAVSERKVNLKEVRGDEWKNRRSSWQKHKDMSQWRDFQVAQKKKTAAKWWLFGFFFLLLCVFLTLPNKLFPSALKRSKKRKDWLLIGTDKLCTRVSQNGSSYFNNEFSGLQKKSYFLFLHKWKIYLIGSKAKLTIKDDKQKQQNVISW